MLNLHFGEWKNKLNFYVLGTHCNYRFQICLKHVWKFNSRDSPGISLHEKPKNFMGKNFEQQSRLRYIKNVFSLKKKKVHRSLEEGFFLQPFSCGHENMVKNHSGCGHSSLSGQHPPVMDQSKSEGRCYALAYIGNSDNSIDIMPSSVQASAILAWALVHQLPSQLLWLLVISTFSVALSFILVWRSTGEKWQITLRGIICEPMSDTFWEQKNKLVEFEGIQKYLQYWLKTEQRASFGIVILIPTGAHFKFLILGNFSLEKKWSTIKAIFILNMLPTHPSISSRQCPIINFDQ